jgi:hypothetical protein
MVRRVDVVVVQAMSTSSQKQTSAYQQSTTDVRSVAALGGVEAVREKTERGREREDRERERERRERGRGE